MAKKLGRGLSALLGDDTTISIQEKDSVFKNISLEKIKTNKDQPRTLFDEEKIDELANSLKSVGLIEPIIVSKEGDRYQIIAGERRFKAAQKAQFETIPAIVKEESKENLLEIMLIENIQREDLNPLEEAMCYEQILKNKKISHDVLAKTLGKSRSYITNHLRLLSLNDKIKNYILSGKLSMGHAKMLVNLSEKEQEDIVFDIMNHSLSVREVEKKIKETKKTSLTVSSKNDQNIFLTEIEEQLRDFFQTKLKINIDKNYNGKIEIDIYGQEDIEKIIEKINKLS